MDGSITGNIARLATSDGSRNQDALFICYYVDPFGQLHLRGTQTFSESKCSTEMLRGVTEKIKCFFPL